jgi:glucokinase
MADHKIAVDLGGTNLRVALVKNHHIVKYIKEKTPKTKNELLNVLVRSIEDLITKKTIGIGVSSAGPLIKGVIKNPPNLPLKNFDLKKFLYKQFKIRVEVENDANCVAIAEVKLGCKKKNFIVLTLGTGIGGGLVVDRKLYTGQGYAAELGHIVMQDGKDFETIWKQDKKLIHKLFGRDLLIKDLIAINNEKSNKMLDKISDNFAKGIGSLINIFDPEIVVLSGGMKETGNKFLNMIKNHAKKYIIIPRTTPIHWTRLDHPGILGASLLIG